MSFSKAWDKKDAKIIKANELKSKKSKETKKSTNTNTDSMFGKSDMKGDK